MAELMAKGSKMFKIRNVWYNMLHRVNNPKNTSFKNYGNRGISVCDSWLDFDTFYKDVESGYQEGLSLDRIDNDKGYFPDNVRWATKKEQANNRRTSRFFEICGVTKTFTEWADFYNVKLSTAKQRFYVLGWTIEESLGVK